MPGELILLVDDEPNIVQLARLYLERENFRVQAVGDGRSALHAVQTARPALVVLDVMLPEMDGFEVCRTLRAQHDSTPILMLTARDEDVDKILGLEIGADDYLTKPFNPRELAARVKAILRRDGRRDPAQPEELRLGDLTISPARREALLAGQALDLRAQEFDLLLTLAQHQGLALTREQLLEQAWGFDYYGQSRTVDVHIGLLRRKLRASRSVRIETLTGVGYKLVVKN